MELTEEEQALLDEKLRLLLDIGEAGTITYFQPDDKKSGGSYLSAFGVVRRIDALRRTVVLADGTVILIEDIVDVSSTHDLMGTQQQIMD